MNDLAVAQTFAQIRGQLLPPPEEPPRCRDCGERSEWHVAQQGHNAGRPYFMCAAAACRKFLVFADSRGNLAGNPACYCGTPSKMQVTNRDGRRVHNVCRLGRCDYYGEPESRDGEPLRLESCAWAQELYEHRLI